MFVINMMPQSNSGETGTDSEPNVAVDPSNPSLIVATAFTENPDPNGNAFIYASTDAGASWTLKPIVPANAPVTADITLRFSGSNRLYAAYLTDDGLLTPRVARTSDLTFNTPMEVISSLPDGDQPYVEATTVKSGADAGKDRVYVGISINNTASMHFSLDAAVANPTFATATLEARGAADGVSYNLPAVRTTIHPSGVVYAAFYSVRIAVDPPGGGKFVDVVVVRDDTWGKGNTPFTSLAGSDGKAGAKVVEMVPLSDTGFGHERAGGELAIAVDPKDSSTVYIAWADSAAGGYAVHVARSTDSGKTWPDELRTVTMTQNPALAVADDGTLGFLFQQYTHSKLGGTRWNTHFQTTEDGTTWIDRKLARQPEAAIGFNSIGDYVHLMTLGDDFYGVFSGINTPDTVNFPSSIIYQRNANFSTKHLLALDGVTTVTPSIDAYFFKDERVDLSINPKVFEIVAEILFGVIQDGGGVVRIGGHIVKIPPWDPEGPIRDILGALATYLRASRANDPSRAKSALAKLQRLLPELDVEKAPASAV